MNSGSSGTSINIDGQALHEEEEAEYQLEEQKQQNELRQLLSNELDDLSDDDNSQEGSDDSANTTVVNDELQLSSTTPHFPNGHPDWLTERPASAAPFLLSQHSTNSLLGSAGAPPYRAPSATPTQYQTSDADDTDHANSTEHTAQYNEVSHIQRHTRDAYESVDDPIADEYSTSSYDVTTDTHSQRLSDLPQQSHNTSDNVVQSREMWMQRPAEYSERGETEGGNELQQQQYTQELETSFRSVPSHNGYYSELMSAHSSLQTSDSTAGSKVYYEPHTAILYAQSLPSYTTASSNQNYVHYVDTQSTTSNTVRYQPVQLEQDDDYKVTYKPAMHDQAIKGQAIKNMEMAGKPDEQLPITEDYEYNSSVDKQLQTLCDARGHKIEDLMGELSMLRDKSEREMRMLQHKLTMAEGERDGAMMSLKESQQLLELSKDKTQLLETNTQTLQAKLDVANHDKEKLIKQLHGAESSIEALNSQVNELQTSETLLRAREQHNQVVSSLQQRHEQQLLLINEKLDAQTTVIKEKDQEIKTLRGKVSALLTASEENQLQRADLVTQLTQRLEDSQKHCQSLLEQGTVQETSTLKLQLQEAIASKSITEDMNMALLDEIKDLKEHISVMESVSMCSSLSATAETSAASGTALSLGAVGTLPLYNNNPDDSYSQLGIKKNLAAEFSTPQSSSTTSTASTEKVVQTMKSELDRCLAIYRNKRQQANKLQEELKCSRVQVEEYKHKTEQLQLQNKEIQEKLTTLEEKCGDMNDSGEAQTVREAQLIKQLNKAGEQAKLLQHNIQELEVRVDEISSSEEKLKEINRCLQTQMSELVQQYDEDKQAALDSCRKVCEQHYEDTKDKWQQEYKESLQKEKETELEEWKKKVDNAREELTSVQAELSNVKESYVELSTAHQQLEAEVTKQWQEQITEQLAQLRVELQSEHEKALDAQRLSLLSEHQLQLNSKQEELTKQHKEEMSKRIEAELALARASWFQTHNENKEAAIRSAQDNKDLEWKEKLEVELKQRLQEAKQEWINNNNIDAQRTNSAKEQNVRQIEEAVREAEERWRNDEMARLSQLPAVKQQISAAVGELRADLTKEHAAAVKRAVEQGKAEGIIDATRNMQRELERVRSERTNTESKLYKLQEQHDIQKKQWDEAKAQELNAALETVRSEFKQDYQTFINEHQQALQAALTQNKQKYEQQIDDLKSVHIKDLQEKEKNLLDLQNTEERIEQLRVSMKQEYESLLASKATEYNSQKEALIAEHEKELQTATQAAKQQALRDCMFSPTPTSTCVTPTPGTTSSTNTSAISVVSSTTCDSCKKLRVQLHAAQQQYTTAAHCIATQRQQLQDYKQQHSRDQSAYQKEVQELKAQLTKLEEHINCRQEAVVEVENLMVKEQELQRELSTVRTENTSLKEELQTAKQSFEENLRKITEKHKELIADMKHKDAQIQSLKNELLEHDLPTSDTLVPASELQQQLQYYKLELQVRQQEHDTKLRRSEKKLKALDAVYRKKLEHQHETLTSEYNLAMEKMKMKMLEQRQTHLMENEETRKEKEQMIERLVKTSGELTETCTASVQTEESMTQYEGLAEMKAYYAKALDKMRSDLLSHVTDSDKRAASIVHAEVLRERRNTTNRLQKYYMRCLSQVLHEKNQWLTYHEKMAYVERALQSVPDRDSNTPSPVTSGCSTPSDAITPVTTPRNHAQYFTPLTVAYNDDIGPTSLTQYTKSRRSTPGDMEGTLSSIATATISTPPSVGRTKSRHVLSVAPDHYNDQYVHGDTESRITLCGDGERQTQNTPSKRARRPRHRGHSAEIAVDSLIGNPNTLSLFKSSSMENIANIPLSTVVAPSTDDPMAVPSSQKYYNLDLDLDVFVKPHVRTITKVDSQPGTSRGDLMSTQPISSRYDQYSEYDKAAERWRSRRQEVPVSPSKSSSLPEFAIRDHLAFTKASDSRQPVEKPTHRRSRSSERPLSNDPIAIQPLSLTLFSPSDVPNSQHHPHHHRTVSVEQRFTERYPSDKHSRSATVTGQVKHTSVSSRPVYTAVRQPLAKAPTPAESSDSESVKSYGSNSSVSDFRHALKSRHAGSTPPPLSRKLHVYPTTSSSRPTGAGVSSKNTSDHNIHKPVAMVTRQTQAPTPVGVTMRPKNHKRSTDKSRKQ